jgi:hypothetical protein
MGSHSQVIVLLGVEQGRMARSRCRCGDVCSWNEGSCGNHLSLRMDSPSVLGASPYLSLAYDHAG